MNLRIPNSKHGFSLASRFIAEFVNRASSFIVFPLMIKYLSPEAYGVNTQIQTLTAYLMTIAGLGLGFYVIKELSGKIERSILSRRFRSSLLLVGSVSLLLGAFLIVFPDLINQWLFRVDWAPEIIRWSFGLLLFSSWEQVIRDFLRARLKIVAYSTMQIFQAVAYVVGVSAVLLAGYGLLEIIQLTIAIRLVSVIMMIAYLAFSGEIELAGGFISRQEQLKAVQWGLPLVASSLSVTIIGNGDRTILGALTDATSVGIYGASYQLANVLLAIGSPFWSLLYPLLATYKNSEDFQGLSHASQRYVNAFAFIGFPAFFGLLCVGPALLGLVGSTTFEIPTFTFFFIILGVFISQFCSPLLYLAYLYQKPTTILIITTASALLNASLNILLIPRMGILAAAINTTVTYTAMDYALCRLVPTTGFREKDLYDYGNIGKFLFASLIMTVGIVLARTRISDTLVSMGLIIAGAIVLYGLTLLLIYGFNIPRLANALLGRTINSK
ncbi:MAG: polysaccharide biosynthesis protein [Leptolinea sp.]|jgi:O-antigen/teichoic acid export membrane protein|nr:polysaccharide biosynthesis protein [Leptolinea sp.]